MLNTANRRHMNVILATLAKRTARDAADYSESDLAWFRRPVTSDKGDR